MVYQGPLDELPGFFLLVMLLGLLCLGSTSAVAQDVTPFMLQNQNPLVQIFGLPPAEAPLLPPPHHLAVRLGFTVSNNFTSEMSGREMLSFDGETFRFQASFRYGLTPGLAVGLDIPFVDHSGGVFDGFIEGWHSAFHLPQGGLLSPMDSSSTSITAMVCDSSTWMSPRLETPDQLVRAIDPWGNFAPPRCGLLRYGCRGRCGCGHST